MSGWATITAMANDEEDAEKLAAALDDAQDDRANWADVRDDERVEALIRGYEGNNIGLRVLKDHAGLWSEAVIMSCNDTVDAGDGAVYESDGTMRGVEKVDSASGAERARGHDAAESLATTEIGRPYMR